MTIQQLTEKINELIESDKEFIQGKIKKAIASGCMDIDGAENNYQLPKNLLSAIYRDMSRQYKPLTSDRKQAKNIDNIYNHI